MHTAPVDAVVLNLGRIREATAPSPTSQLGSPSVSSRTKPSLRGPHAASPSPSSPKSIDTFDELPWDAMNFEAIHCHKLPNHGNSDTPPIPGLCFHRCSIFYALS